LASVSDVQAASESILEDGGGIGAIDRSKVKGAGADVVKVQVTSIKASHSPFLSRVEETAQWVRRCCGEDI